MPLEVLPMLPDFDCWPNKYVQAHFDNDPTEEVCKQKLLHGIRDGLGAWQYRLVDRYGFGKSGFVDRYGLGGIRASW